MLKFQILGPVEIHTPTRVARPRGTLRRLLLVTFLVNANKFVSAEVLIGELWGDRHPSRAGNALQAHVSQLRAKVASLEPGTGAPRLITHPSGYEFLVDDDDLDAARFMRGFERIRSHAEDDPARTAQKLRSILALWQGPLFGGLAGGHMCQAAAARYGEARLAALELLFDGELKNGKCQSIIPQLLGLLAEYPFQEHFWQQLMLALYRSGRQAEALNAYRELRRRLADELGLEPSLAARELERAILSRDPVLDSPSRILAS